jgi:hypothetical protein
MRSRLDREPLDVLWVLIVLATIGFVIFMVVSCINTPTQGTVIGKKYYPSYTTTSWNCMSYDSKGGCSLRLPHSDFHAETWQLCLRNVEEDKEGCRAVDQVDYHKYEIGQWYP